MSENFVLVHGAWHGGWVVAAGGEPGLRGITPWRLPLEVFQGAFMATPTRPRPRRCTRAAPAAVPHLHRPTRRTRPTAALGIPLHYVLSSEDVALAAGRVRLGPFRRADQGAPGPGCPAATSPCSPARPSWPTPWPRVATG